ncbi:plasmid mobilization protein [Actinoallomurus soli]|uniref:plasmid mobilization protein n=1 Tax=Actinoallomurus soli TaxID=2952535 RepID=UPI0020926C75|nr:ribbon-helix-helix protein, CopG family [Actinoallomurus soli]MCO5972863.1 ribbon-helix-helix protein, CopG family [Actinoallomurus soli]
MSDADAAEFYYEQRDNPEVWGEQVEARVSRKLDSVVSVRFNSAEIERIQQAADAAGLSLSAFIRRAALTAPGAEVIDLERARKDMAQARRFVIDALRALHA